MVRDLVCSAEVDETKAGANYDYQGHIYYFCAPTCRDRFIDLFNLQPNLPGASHEGIQLLETTDANAGKVNIRPDPV